MQTVQTFRAQVLGLVAAATAAVAAAPELSVSARNPLPISSDGEHLIFSFELATRNAGAAPAQVKGVDYTVTIEGVRFFAGNAQGFTVEADSERTTPIAGFSIEGERQILAALRGSERFKFQVTGVVHLRAEGGSVKDQAFTASGGGATPDEIAQAPERRTAAGRYSLLSY